MKRQFTILLITLAVFACEENREKDSVHKNNWNKRKVDLNPSDSLQIGRTYLSVYAQIYSRSEHRTHDLTATVSLRNVSDIDTIYVTKTEYFATNGSLIRAYFDQAIFIAPMETVEIVIDEMDNEGGTGANFMFDWQTKKGTPEPLFEAVMISTSGQQGISFTAQGKRIR